MRSRKLNPDYEHIRKHGRTRETADIYFFSREQFTGQENADAKQRQIVL